MPIEKTKLNILNRVIDFGADTEKKITALDIHEMLEIPNIKTPELKIILDLQDAIKKRETIAFLSDAKAESECFLQVQIPEICRQKWRILHLRFGESCRLPGRIA